MPASNQHLVRARAAARAAGLRERVVKALQQLLEEDLGSSPGFDRYRLERQEAPSNYTIQTFLEPRVASWPPEMRAYLFANLGQILRLVQQQQQQQQQIQQQQQQQSQQQSQIPLSAVLLRMLEPQLEAARAEAGRARRVETAIEGLTGAGTDVAEPPARDAVQFEIYGPQQAPRSSPFNLDLWAFLESQREKVEKFAARAAERKSAAPAAQVARNSVLAVQVYSADFAIKDAVRPLAWNGQETFESFECMLNAASAGRYFVAGNAVITLNGLLLAKIDFSLPAGDAAGGTGSLHQTAKRPQTAFASYASENRIEVERSVQGIEKGAPDLHVWLDVESLRAGENWEEKLYSVIATSDILYLFWSQAAAKSEWVAREWRYGLKEKGLAFIDPFPLESPQLAPPPEELKALHFNDRHLMAIYAEQQIQAQKAGRL